jgi:hypothetical protein
VVTQPFEHTSLDVAVARLEVQLATLNRDLTEFRAETKVSNSELSARMGALETHERERNGHIRELVHYRGENEQHWAEHMSWASEQVRDLNQIGDAVAVIQEERHDGKVKASVWKSQAKFILGGGGAGSLLTALVGVALWVFKIL